MQSVEQIFLFSYLFLCCLFTCIPRRCQLNTKLSGIVIFKWVEITKYIFGLGLVLWNPSSLQEEAIKMDSLHVHFKWVKRLYNNIKQHTSALKMIYTLLHLLILITLNILYQKKKFTLEIYHVHLWTYGIYKMSLLTTLYPHFKYSITFGFVWNLDFFLSSKKEVIPGISKKLLYFISRQTILLRRIYMQNHLKK